MTERSTSLRLPILISFVLFISVLMGLFSYQVKGALKGFDRWVGHEDHRLPNLLQIEKSCRWPVIDRFMDLQPLADADAFVMGDSQVFARGATQEELFYTHWLGKDSTVINFSYFGAPVDDLYQIADELKSRGHKAELSYMTLNLTHFTTSSYAPEIGRILSINDGKLPIKPKGLKSLLSNRYVCAFKYRRDFTTDKLRTPRYRKLTLEFKKVPLPKTYVDFRASTFQRVTDYYFEEYPSIADRMIIASAPMAYDKFELYDFDEKSLDDFSVAFQELCREHPKIECHDLTRSMTSEGFMDLIHMNAVGHKLLGQELARTKAKN